MKRQLVTQSPHATKMEQTVESTRKNSSLTIYNHGSAVVEDVIMFNVPKESVGAGGTMLSKLSSFGGSTARTLQKRTFEIAVPSVSAQLVPHTLFALTAPSVDEDPFEVESVHYRVPTSIGDHLETLSGTEVELLDVAYSRDQPIPYRGVSKGVANAGRMGVLLTEDGRLTVVPISSNMAVSSQAVKFPYYDSHIRMVVKERDGARVRDDGVYEKRLMYETEGLSYAMSYAMLVDSNEETMTLLLKAEIRNTTGSAFKSASVRLVERPPSQASRYAKKRTMNVRSIHRYQQQEAAPPVPTEALSMAQDSGGAAQGFQTDLQEEQKTYNIDKPLDIPKTGKQEYVVREHDGVAARMEYVFRAHHNNYSTSTWSKVRANLVWENSRENANLGFLLPSGEASVYLRPSVPSRAPSLLGRVMIGSEHASKAVVRLDLGEVNMIHAKLENLGTVKRETRTKDGRLVEENVTKYRLSMRNSLKKPFQVVLKHTFPTTDWRVEGDVDFEEDVPDNKSEKVRRQNARAFVNVPVRTSPDDIAKYEFSLVSAI